MPINYLIVESLRSFYHYYGDDLKVECPAGSGQWLTLAQVADDLSIRLQKLFLPDQDGQRPANHRYPIFGTDPHWRDLVLYYEHFHGDHGAGLGASHQTGWTALVANLIQQGPAPAR